MPLPDNISQSMLPGCGRPIDEEAAEAAWAKLCCDNCGGIRSKFYRRGELRLCLTCSEEWDTDPEEVEEAPRG
jgi:hypothetical protein